MPTSNGRRRLVTSARSVSWNAWATGSSRLPRMRVDRKWLFSGERGSGPPVERSPDRRAGRPPLVRPRVGLVRGVEVPFRHALSGL